MKENFITLVERMTRFTIAIKHETKSPSATAMSIIRKLTPIKAHVRSITYNQGTEFFQHHWIASCLDAKNYFCHLVNYSSCQTEVYPSKKTVLKKRMDCNINSLKMGFCGSG